MRVFPLAMEKIFKVAKANVLVFIPPAVDAGEPPIHIKKIINNNVDTFIVVKSTVLKPAVLGVMALNAEVVIFPKSEVWACKVA